MCEDFPLYTFNDEIVSYMGITCTKTDLFKNLSLSKDIHDALQIIEKRFTFIIIGNNIMYNFINFRLETNLVSYYITDVIVYNIKNFIENFNIMLVSLDIYNKKYYKYNHSISTMGTMKILSSYAGICCSTWHVSHDIHQNIEILMDFLSQNFVNPDIYHLYI